MQYEGRQKEKSGKRQRGAGAVEISPLAALGRNDIVVLEEYTCLPLEGKVLSEAKRMRCTQVGAILSLGRSYRWDSLRQIHLISHGLRRASFPSRGSQVLWFNTI